jgi:hypothetical protein
MSLSFGEIGGIAEGILDSVIPFAFCLWTIWGVGLVLGVAGDGEFVVAPVGDGGFARSVGVVGRGGMARLQLLQALD